MSNIKLIPFTEIVERVQDLSRSGADTKSRIRGLVNEIYTQEIPRSHDYTWLKASSAISCLAQYDSGTVTVTTQDTVCTFSGAVISTDMTGRKIKFDGNSDIYDFTYSDSTGGTISPSLSGITSVSGGGYTIFKNIYSLPADFDRFPINGGLLFYSAGQPTPLPEMVDNEYYAEANASPTSIPDGCRMLGYDTAGNLQFEVIPPPSVAYVLMNEYLRVLNPMKENTMGTIVVTSNQTAVSGTGTVFTSMSTGDYLRADGFGKNNDSAWYRINAITNDTTMTVSTFRKDSSYSGSFTISSVPEMPYRLHPAIIYGAIERVLADEKNPVFLMSHTKYAEMITNAIIMEQSRHARDDVELIAEDPDYRW